MTHRRPDKIVFTLIFVFFTACLQSVSVPLKPFISLHHYQRRAATFPLWGKKKCPSLVLIIISTSLHPLMWKVQTGGECAQCGAVRVGDLSPHPAARSPIFSPAALPVFSSSSSRSFPPDFPTLVHGTLSSHLHYSLSLPVFTPAVLIEPSEQTGCCDTLLFGV